MRLRAVNIGLAATVILLSMVPGIQGLPKWLQPKHEVNDEILGPRQYSVYKKPTVTYGGYTYGGYGPAPTLTNIFETSSAIPSSEVSSSSASSSETTSSSQTSNKLSSSLSTGVELSTTTAASSSVGLLASSSAVTTESPGESPGVLSSSSIVEVTSTAGGAVSSASSLEPYSPSSAPVILTSPIPGSATLTTSSEKGRSSSPSAHETSSVFVETTSIAIGTVTSLPNFISSILYGLSTATAVESSMGTLSSNTTSSEIGLANSPPSPSTSTIYGLRSSGPASSSVISTPSGIGNLTSLQSSSLPVAGPSSTPNMGTTSSGTSTPFKISTPIVYVSTIVYNESSQSILSSTSTTSSVIGIFTTLSSSSTPNSYILSISGPVLSSVSSSVETPTGGITSQETISTSPSLGITTTAPATTNNGYPINCNHNNCLRALLRSSSLAAEFCATYTTSTNTVLPTAFPGFVSKCYDSPAALSSACSCAVSGPATKMPSSMLETSSVIYSLTSLVSASSSSQETSTPVQNTQISSVAVITSTPLGTEISGILHSQSSSSILYTNSTSIAEATISSVVSGGFSSTMPLLPRPTLPYTASNTSTYGPTASGFSILSAVGVFTPLTSSYPLSAMPINPSTSASWYSPFILSSTVPYLGSSTLMNGPTPPGFSTSSAVGIATSLSSPSYPLSGSGTKLSSSSSPANSTAFHVGASGTSPATTIEATSFITENLPAETSTVVPQVSSSAPASIVVLSSSGSKGSLPTSTGSGETALPGTSQTGISVIPSSSSHFGTGLQSRIPYTSGTLYGVSNTSSVYQITSTGTVPSSTSPVEFTSSAVGFAASTTPFGNSNSTFSSGAPHSSKSHMRKLHKSKTHSSKTSAGFTSPTPVSSSVLYPVNNQPSLVGPSGTGSMPSSTTFAPLNSTGTQSGIPTSHYSVPYSAGSSPSGTSTNGGIAISLTSSAPFPIFSVTYISTSTGTGVAPSFSLPILSTVGLPPSSTPTFSLNSTLSILPISAGNPVTSTAQGVIGSGLSTISLSSRSVSQDTCTEEYEYPSNTRSLLVPTSMAQSSSQLPASLPSSTLAGSGAFGNQISSIPSTFATSYGTAPQKSDSETPSSYLRLPTLTLVTGITTSENSGFATSLFSNSQSVPSQPTSSSAALTSTYAAPPYYYQTSKARRFLAPL